MKFGLRAAFLAVLVACAPALAQRSALVDPLPQALEARQVLEIARGVFVARGWAASSSDSSSLLADKDLSSVRVFVADGALYLVDRSQRARGGRQRGDRGTPLAAVPQQEIDALRSDLASAIAGAQGAVAAAPAQSSSAVLLLAPAWADPKEAMTAARTAFVGRRWAVKDDADGGFVADIHGAQESATLKVFFADGALRFIDRSTDRRGGRAQVPERWLNNIRSDLRQPMSLLATRPAPKPAPREAAPPAGDAAERLRQLKTLLDGGLITKAEYDTKRAEILKGL